MTDLLNPSPPPGEHPARPADAEAGIPGSADPRGRARARQDRAGSSETGTATPAAGRADSDIRKITGFLIGCAVAAAAVSCLGWFGLALMAGWPEQMAWLPPVNVDAFGLAAAWVWLRSRWVSRRTRHFAAWCATLAIVESVAAQVLDRVMDTGTLVRHYGHGHHAGPVAPLYIVIAMATLAPITLALAAHLIALVNGDRAALVKAEQDDEAERVKAQRAEAAERAEAERTEAARVAADRAATERAEAERAAAAQQAEADRAATARAAAEAAAARARTTTDGPPMGHPGDVAHGPDTDGGPSGGPSAGDVGHGPGSGVAHGPGASEVDDGDDPGVPWTLPAGEPDEQGDPGDIYVQARNAYRQSCRDNKPLSPRAIAAKFPGKSRNWGKTRITEVQKGIHLARAAGE